MRDSDPLPLFEEALETPSEIDIAHLELREPPVTESFRVGEVDPLASRLTATYSVGGALVIAAALLIRASRGPERAI